LSALHPRYPQTAKTNNAGAQQRRGVQIIQGFGHSKKKVISSDGIFRITAIHGISSKSRGITEVFEGVAAIPAVTINSADPRDSDPSPEWQIRCIAASNFAHDLVTRNESWTML